MKWKILLTAVVALLLYNSVYFEKLSVRRNNEQVQLFDAVTYARDFWDNRLPIVVFNMGIPGNILKIVTGETVGTTVGF